MHVGGSLGFPEITKGVRCDPLKHTRQEMLLTYEGDSLLTRELNYYPEDAACGCISTTTPFFLFSSFFSSCFFLFPPLSNYSATRTRGALICLEFGQGDVILSQWACVFLFFAYMLEIKLYQSSIPETCLVHTCSKTLFCDALVLLIPCSKH